MELKKSGNKENIFHFKYSDSAGENYNTMLNNEHFGTENIKSLENIKEALVKELGGKKLKENLEVPIQIDNCNKYLYCALPKNKNCTKKVWIFSKYCWGDKYNSYDSTIYKLENNDFAVVSEEIIKKIKKNTQLLGQFQKTLEEGRVIKKKGSGVKYSNNYFYAEVKIPNDPRLLCKKPSQDCKTKKNLLIFDHFEPKHPQ